MVDREARGTGGDTVANPDGGGPLLLLDAGVREFLYGCELIRFKLPSSKRDETLDALVKDTLDELLLFGRSGRGTYFCQ